MQRHPLEIPEILAAVGSFLPLWKQPYPARSRPKKARFEPKTLVTCLLVSKLWYKTLLPIIWHGYWRFDNMGLIPKEAIRRNSHFLRALELNKWPHVDMRVFECTNLVELKVFVGVSEIEDQQTKEGEEDKVEERALVQGAEVAVKVEGGRHRGGGGEEVVPLPHGRRLLRSNPGIKILALEGLEFRNDANTAYVRPVLDTADFVALERLESLSLDSWDCTEGRLEQVLSTVSKTLRELRVGRNCGLRPELLKDNGGLVLERLESLKWTCYETVDAYLCELVKRCPNLRSLKVKTIYGEWNFSRLADSLRTSCPKFDTLKLHAAGTQQHLEALIRDSSTSGFRTLHIAFEGNTDKLMALIIGHAATLEYLHVSPLTDHGDSGNYLRLMVECTRLRCLSYKPVSVVFVDGFFRALTQQRWRCQGLEELRIELGTGVLRRYGKYTEDERREVEELLGGLGWEEVSESCEEDRLEPINIIELRNVLRLLALQELESMRVLWMDEFTFHKICSRS
ncbi:hypothetical protein BGZ96_007636 [Linnemannia gamsii]|uniref:F-box domain-containing protein n=1 Tax=Linnemannia gamsii TaxID=64522 RepID=A0ABQ7KK05_9FUNG|nr:hypothetical protein BGZ96_007636 [Linnemannia gamsii]